MFGGRQVNIPASSIGLPTRGGTITNVQEVPASAAVPKTYCLVSGKTGS